MTGIELFDDLIGKLGNTRMGLTETQLYRNLNESKKWHERNTNISFKGDVGIICPDAAGSISLSASTINLDANFSLITIEDDSVIFDDNWDGWGVPPFVDKTSTQHIRMLRNTNDITGDPQLYAIHRAIESGAGILKLELYPAVTSAQDAFATSKLRCDIKQLSPEISSSTANDTLLIPDYSEQATAFKAAMDIKMASKAEGWLDMKVAWNIELRTVRSISNSQCTGGVRQRLAQ